MVLFLLSAAWSEPERGVLKEKRPKRSLGVEYVLTHPGARAGEINKLRVGFFFSGFQTAPLLCWRIAMPGSISSG